MNLIHLANGELAPSTHGQFWRSRAAFCQHAPYPVRVTLNEALVECRRCLKKMSA